MSVINPIIANRQALHFKFGNADEKAEIHEPKINLSRSSIGVDPTPYIQLKLADNETAPSIVDQVVKFNEIVLNNFKQLSSEILHASSKVMAMLDSVAGQMARQIEKKAAPKTDAQKAEPAATA